MEMKLKLDQKVAWVIGAIERVGGDLLPRGRGWYYVGSEFSAMLWGIFYFLFGDTLPEYKPLRGCKVVCGECDWEGYGESWYDHYERTGHGRFTWKVENGQKEKNEEERV